MTAASPNLFPDTLLAEMRRLPGASHSFLKQLCQPAGDEARVGLTQALKTVDPHFHARLLELLHSLDNRRFFQGFAELSTLVVLQKAGWRGVETVGPGQIMRMERPDGRPINAIVLAFLTGGRMGVEPRAVLALREALERVGSRLRFGVYVRKWLPHDFKPEPVRQAVEMWLREVESGNWDGRFAAYEDESVSLEFGLTGEVARPGQSVVVLSLGPFMAGRTVQILEASAVRTLDRYRMGKHGKESAVLVAVGDQPWQLSRGYMREFLYGKPRWIFSSDRGEGWEAGFVEAERDPCLFKDPLYRNVPGVILLERPIYDAMGLIGRAYSNPFANSPLRPPEIPFRVLAKHRDEGDAAVVRWFQKEERVIRLGSLA
jgi:hypothetical protein